MLPLVDLLAFDELDLSDFPDDDQVVEPESEVELELCQVEPELELSLELCHDSLRDRTLSLYFLDCSILPRERCFPFLVLAYSTDC